MSARTAPSPQRTLLSHITPSPHLTSKRGHTRSSSLENGNSFIAKNTLGLPIMQPGQSGTLKSRNEQKRMRSKYGSHNNLDDYTGQATSSQLQLQQQTLQQQQLQQKQGGGGGGGGRLRFQNIRQFFEINKTSQKADFEATPAHSMPASMTQSETAATLATQLNTRMQQQQHQHQQHKQQQQQSNLSQRRPTPTRNASGSGNRNSIASDITSTRTELPTMPHLLAQQQQQQQQQQHQQHQKQQQQQQQAQQQHQANGFSSNMQSAATPDQSASNILRPIAFRPIPFEPDYSIPSRFCDMAVAATGPISDRFGSTPSLVPTQSSHLRFGSTSDLRNNSKHGIDAGAGAAAAAAAAAGGGGGGGGVAVCGVGGGIGVGVGVGVGVSGGPFASYSGSNYCNSLMARRRGSRSLKINDSMESIRHTPDMEANSQGSNNLSKINCVAMNKSNNNNNSNNNSNNNNIIGNNASLGNGGSNNHSKYILEQCDMTPSPSDSGISDLEAALKDRDSELSYLRQTMEHNENDKEAFWENETKRLKAFYDEQQREYILKMKKMEQVLAMQQFQFKQHKLRHAEQSNKMREQISDFKHENEILRSDNTSLKNSERNLKDRLAYIEEQVHASQSALGTMKSQLEESEWKVCERNGEIALLKTQLKEANVEITLKEHAIVHLKHENLNAETQICQSQQENLQKQINENHSNATNHELKQLNKIVILKDQVILALTNELAKLRKELSDLAISHEYGEEPSGKFTRLKQQLDSLSDICIRKRKQDEHFATQSKAKVIDDSNLEVIMNCLKITAPALHSDDSSNFTDDDEKLSSEKRLAKMSADIQRFVYGSQNLPDVAVSIHSAKPTKVNKVEEATLDTLIEESANYAEEISKLRRQLDDVRVSFEMEKRQWSEEKEKVLRYQKQLQTHYINMYQKLRSLESSIE